jgi:DNA repair protein SbcD/Mre11
MRIIHTSDWHLGAQLHEQSRIPEQAAFLEWLKGLLKEEKPDALLVAGDIFDSCAPSNAAQNLYYDFLAATYKDNLCRAVVVVGGNHDSPSLLDAPGKALSHLHAHVVGTVAYRDSEGGGRAPIHEKEVVVVPDANGYPGLVVAAVPYLRDADLRTSEAMESDADRTAKLKRGFQAHYRAVADLALRLAALPDGGRLPLVLTGHLYLTGATIADKDSERSLRIGNLESIERELLPPADYVALGHLHSPQAVGGCETCRYSGSPIPMAFGEARQTKSVVRVDFHPGQAPAVQTLPVPVFQKLVPLAGTPEEIDAKLQEQIATREPVWIDIQVTEGEGDLAPWWRQYETQIENTPIKMLRKHNARPGKVGSGLAIAIQDQVDLEQLTPQALFGMRLDDEEGLGDDDKALYAEMFAEIVREFHEADVNKE